MSALRHPSRLLLIGTLLITLSGCGPSGGGDGTVGTDAATQSRQVTKVGRSATVRINGRPVARALDGGTPGAMVLSADCEGVRSSPNVRINGAPVAIVAGALTGCDSGAVISASGNVRVGN